MAALGVTALSVVLAATVAPTTPAIAEEGSSPGSSAAAEPARTADVMTRNLYLGADLMPVIQAMVSDPEAVPAAATATWTAVQATNPPERMAEIADEIVAERPAVVGLQEVTRWMTYSGDPSTTQPTVAYDFLDLLVKALAERGVVYHEVTGATANNFASPPVPVLPGAGITAVQMADRDVVLRRDDVAARNAHHGTFTHIISFPVAGSTLPVRRGWGSVDVRTRRATFRFVNAHLEAFGVPGVDAEALRFLQVGELLAAQSLITEDFGALPTVYVGDYNSEAPTGLAYERLVSGGRSDAWLTAGRGAGYTCCFDAEVSDPNATLDERIDLVVTDVGVQATEAEVIGDELEDRTPSGLWPSDHAGVVARLVVGSPEDESAGR